MFLINSVISALCKGFYMRLFVVFVVLLSLSFGTAHSRSLQSSRIAVPVKVNLKAIAYDSVGGYSVKKVIKSSLWSKYSPPKRKQFVPVTAWILKSGYWGEWHLTGYQPLKSKKACHNFIYHWLNKMKEIRVRKGVSAVMEKGGFCMVRIPKKPNFLTGRAATITKESRGVVPRQN